MMETRIIVLKTNSYLRNKDHYDLALDYVRNREKESHVCGPLAKNSGSLFTLIDGSDANEDVVKWMTAEEFASCEQREDNDESANNESIDQSVVFADRLHAVAESLPKSAADTHLLWLHGDQWPDIENSVELYGALKRLVTWHNTLVTMVTSDLIDEEQHSLIGSWSSVLSASVATVTEMNESGEAPLWHGSVKLHGAEILQPVVLPGFALRKYKSTFPKYRWSFSQASQQPKQHQEEPVLLDTCMHFLTSLNIRDLPAFYITSHAYTLDVSCSKQHKSKKFLSALTENPQLGYLVRLYHGSTWKDSTDARNHKRQDKQRSWADSLLENINNIMEPVQNSELAGKKGSYHFLLCGGQGQDGSHVVKAHLMRAPADLNDSLAHIMAELETKRTCDKHEEAESTELASSLTECLEALPHYRAETFLQLETKIQEAQIRTLQLWQESSSASADGSSNVITGGDLLYLLSATRRRFMASYREMLRDMQVPYPESYRKRVNMKADVEWPDPDQMLEKKMLVYRAKVQEKLKRTTSNDSLGGLSPPSSAHVIKLQASELLKYFNSDGTPVDTDLQPLQVKKSRLRKYDSGELCKSEWPQCSHYKYHDVYYNVGESPEKRATKCARLSERMRTAETASTCTTSGSRDSTLRVPSVARDSGTAKRRRNSVSRGVNTPRRLKSVTTPTRRSRLHKTPNSRERGRKRSLSNTRTPPRANSSEKAGPQRKRMRPSVDTTPKRDANITPVTRAAPSTQAKTEPIRRTKTKLEAKVTPGGQGTADDKITPTGQNPTSQQSRSARHKQKLEDTVRDTLGEQGVTEDDAALYGRCYKKLYQLTFAQVKTLKSSAGLRQEMQRIAREHAEMVVMFEQTKVAKETAAAAAKG